MNPSRQWLNLILGKHARLTRTTWVCGINEVVEGRIICYSETPIYLVELADGHRRVVGADCDIELLNTQATFMETPRESDVYSSTERASGWDHDQREPIGFRAGGV